jgi:hypothetical protein
MPLTHRALGSGRIMEPACEISQSAYAQRLEAVIDSLARFSRVTTALVLREDPAKPIGWDLLSNRTS